MPLDESTAATLGVRLAIEGAAVAGRAVLARIEVVNRGTAPVLASRRLNLMEGDVRLRIADPSGAARVAPGWQVDSGLDRVELAPGSRLVGALNLLDGGDGPLFTEPGRYGLAADYYPSPRTAAVASEDLTLSVAAAESEEDKALAGLLRDERLRRALLFAEADAAPAALRGLAEAFGGTLEGELARLVLADGAPGPADWERAEAALGAVRLALAVLGLANPRSGAGQSLTESLAGWLAPRAADAAAGEALAIVRREPLPGA